MKIRINKKIVLFFILWLCADNLFWITGPGLRTLATEIFWMISLVAFVFNIILCTGRRKQLFHNQVFGFGKLMLFPIIMALYSAVQAHIMYGQSLILGLLPQRFMVMGFLLYFVLADYCVQEDHREKIRNAFLTLGKIEMVLYVTQYFLLGRFNFLNVPYMYRLGEIRMTAGALAVHFLIFETVNQIMNEKKIRPIQIFWLIMGLYYAVVIGKTRILLVAYPLAILGAFLVWRKGGIKKLAVFCVFVIVIVCMTQTDLFNFLIEGLLNKDSSAQIRTVGREFYMNRLSEHPFLGCGYVNMKNQEALRASGYYDNIFWVDLGIYGLAFFFGLAGVIWMLIWFGKMAYMSYKIALSGDYMGWMYMIFLVVTSINSTPFLWSVNGIVSYVVLTALIDAAYKKRHKKISR